MNNIIFIIVIIVLTTDSNNSSTGAIKSVCMFVPSGKNRPPPPQRKTCGSGGTGDMRGFNCLNFENCRLAREVIPTFPTWNKIELRTGSLEVSDWPLSVVLIKWMKGRRRSGGIRGNIILVRHVSQIDFKRRWGVSLYTAMTVIKS